MYCYQCEQTAKGCGCTGNMGVCGKKEYTSELQDRLTGALIGLARAIEKDNSTEAMDRAMVGGFFMTITNVSFDNVAIQRQINLIRDMKHSKTLEYNMSNLWECEDPDIKSAKSLILFGMRGIAAYAYHALALKKDSQRVIDFFYEGLRAIGSDKTFDQLLPLVLKTGEINLECMELLDVANTEAYGTPAPAQVTTNIEAGPFIVVSGHDLKDLEMLLKQSEGKGVNIYTHGEMLPAHGYPQLKKYKHLKGNFGTAWQNQQKEFDQIPGSVLFTTNCIMPVKDSYADRVFTTGPVAYPGLMHVFDDKDFSPVIERAIELGGYKEEHKMTGINGGEVLTTGFGHGAILANAGAIVDAVKGGDISHFFLVGGCDGAKPGRNYFTEFVQKTPKDSVILTLACGKYRFNDLDLGTVAGLSRLLDMGQCNDAYGAIKVAVALSQAFDCDVNELPLSMVLSWYEQKAVCILLTLFHLGIKNIYLGPTLPAFISENVLNYLVDTYNVKPTSDADTDLAECLSK